MIEIKAQIGNIETLDLNNISIEKDINLLIQSCSFSLPDISDYRGIKKNDSFKLYISNSDTKTPYTDIQIFTGFINSIHPVHEKENQIINLTAFDLMGLTAERTLLADVIENELSIWMDSMLEKTELKDNGTGEKIIYEISEDYRMNPLFILSQGGNNFKTVIDGIKEKHAVYIFLTGAGRLRVTSPFYLHSQTKNNNSSFSFEAWEFEVGENIIKMDYGDVTTDINTVIVEGLGTGINSYPLFSTGIAVDVLGVQLSGGRYIYESFKHFDITGQEQADEVARNILLKMQEKHTVEIQTIFSPFYELGDPFYISNDERFTGNEIFMIKNISISISKESFETRIKGIKHTLTELPSEIVMSGSGIADVDSLISLSKDKEENYWGV